MDDELEDKVFYQTYITHMRLLSKFAMGVTPLNSTLAYIWKLLRLYFIRPEVLLVTLLFIVFLVYLQALEMWSRGLVSRIGTTLSLSSMRYGKSNNHITSTMSPAERQSWDDRQSVSAVYAVQGRRPRMEDRFVIDENVNETGISFFAIFDGHGGDFAAVFAKDHLVNNLYNKITETSDILKGKIPASPLPVRNKNLSNDCNNVTAGADGPKKDDVKPTDSNLVQRRSSFKKSFSTAEDCVGGKLNCNREQDVFMDKINSLVRTKDSLLKGNNNNNAPPKTFEAKCYIQNGVINFGKMITDEVLAADYKLIEAAKRTTNVAGTTVLIAVLHKTKLVVANVGDSRGVMCDARGNAIPLSFDHKPQQTRELKRIQEAGGFIAFKGVWRVAGILATSRAMGDYPLKEKHLVIADPDILKFDLADHKPKFLILASDGLWDTFTNEEAVAFIKEHIDEPHFGAKSITLQSYYRGSVDNITVLIIVFKGDRYEIGSSMD